MKEIEQRFENKKKWDNQVKSSVLWGFHNLFAALEAQYEIENEKDHTGACVQIYVSMNDLKDIQKQFLKWHDEYMNCIGGSPLEWQDK